MPQGDLTASLPRTKIETKSVTTALPSLLASAVLGSAAFQIAFEVPALNCLTVLGAWFLICLSRANSGRVAFRLGFLSGMLVFAPQLSWFWRIFGPAAICLWAVLSAFSGLLVTGGYAWRTRFGVRWLWLTIPVLWTGLEYFRSELYYLRFSWLSVGYAYSDHFGALPVGAVGVYGAGFLVFSIAAFAEALERRRKVIFLIGATVALAILSSLPQNPRGGRTGQDVSLKVSGIQLEFPPDLQVPEHLGRVLNAFPETDLILLSEYTFDGPVPPRVRDWCRQHHKYLVAGGKKEAGENGAFFNTAFVIGPTGEIVFEQVKSVPIQFFKDGIPAVDQKVWLSPWGPIAICICYDMSYRSVMDRYMRLGAKALLVPFMDVTEWGERQHRLHSRIGSVRAREYRIPIFRVGSSGISQLIDENGRISATAAFPGQEEIIGGEMKLNRSARLPFDSWLSPACTLAAGTFLLATLARPLVGRIRNGPRRTCKRLGASLSRAEGKRAA